MKPTLGALATLALCVIFPFPLPVRPPEQPGRPTRFFNEFMSRLLVPALAAPPAAQTSRQSASLLLHTEQLVAGVYVAGFADRHGSANCGWIAGASETMLVDLPRGVNLEAFLAEVERSTKKPARTLVLTQLQTGDDAVVETLLGRGIARIVTSPAIRDELLRSTKRIAPAQVHGDVRTIATAPMELVVMDGSAAKGGAALYLPKARVLFAGPLVVHGPRVKLQGNDTARWLEAVRQLESLGATRVVPGFGSWGDATLLTRQRRFLAEVRRQVGHVIAQGRPRAALADGVRIPDELCVWMPYDYLTSADLAHVYEELTVPAAPFNGHLPSRNDPKPHALVLIGDQPHEPGHIEAGLRPVFTATGVVPHFTVDVRALTAENLARVQLLVILRDGLQRPTRDTRTDFVWMTAAQEQAVVDFVHKGGALLNLHNSLALYPAGGPYLQMLGGRYTTHGPLERFRVEVVDPTHPITRGIKAFSIADEQHMPECDTGKVQVLLRSRSDEGRTFPAGWALAEAVRKEAAAIAAPQAPVAASVDETAPHNGNRPARGALSHMVGLRNAILAPARALAVPV